jgi:hypothetical protein
MSEENTPVEPTVEPKAEKKPKRDAKPKTVAEVAIAIAKAKKTDPKVEAKKLRGYIRANFDTLAKQWPALRKVGKVNRDGNRYPPVPASLAKELITKRSKSAK